MTNSIYVKDPDGIQIELLAEPLLVMDERDLGAEGDGSRQVGRGRRREGGRGTWRRTRTRMRIISSATCSAGARGWL